MSERDRGRAAVLRLLSVSSKKLSTDQGMEKVKAAALEDVMEMSAMQRSATPSITWVKLVLGTGSR